jgi:hypothetical protein
MIKGSGKYNKLYDKKFIVNIYQDGGGVDNKKKNMVMESLIDDNIDFRNDSYPYFRDEELTKIAKSVGYEKNKNTANSLGEIMYFDLQKYFLEKYNGTTYKSGAKEFEPTNDGEVQFIEYKDEEIMYEPNENKYYTNDEEFDTLKQAQNYIDKGSPMSAKTINAYRKGAFKDGGAVGKKGGLYSIGDKVNYLGEIATITDYQPATRLSPAGQPTYHLTYSNNFSTLDSSSNFVREDLLKPIKKATGGGVGEIEYKIGDIFEGNPKATYEENWQLFKPLKSYVIDNKTNKIVSIHKTPYEAIEKRNSLDKNFKLHYEVKPKEFYNKMETGGGVDINDWDMPVIRSQFEEEEFEFGQGGGIYSRTMKTPDGNIMGKVQYNDFWKTYQVVIDGVVEEEFKTKDEAIENLKNAGFYKMALGGPLSKGDIYKGRTVFSEDGSYSNLEDAKKVVYTNNKFFKETNQSLEADVVEYIKKIGDRDVQIIKVVTFKKDKMALGGGIPNNYLGKGVDEVWNYWTETQRLHFLLDHQVHELHPSKVMISFNELPPKVRVELIEHISEGQYREGGGIANIHSKVLDYLAKHKFNISTFGRTNNNNIKVDDRNFGIDDQIAIEKIHPKINVSGSSNSNIWYIFMPNELANGGGVDINDWDMPVIRTQFEDEEYEFEEGGEITADERMKSLKNYPKLKL